MGSLSPAGKGPHLAQPCTDGTAEGPQGQGLQAGGEGGGAGDCRGLASASSTQRHRQQGALPWSLPGCQVPTAGPLLTMAFLCAPSPTLPPWPPHRRSSPVSPLPISLTREPPALIPSHHLPHSVHPRWWPLGQGVFTKAITVTLGGLPGAISGPLQPWLPVPIRLA